MAVSVHDPALKPKLAAVRLVVFDVDGVMTDGTSYYTDKGLAMKGFSMRDGFGFVMGKAAGLDFAVITGNVVELLKRRLEKFHIDRIKGGHFRKSGFFEQILAETGIPAAQTAYIGDDLFDIPVFKLAGVALAPADAHPAVAEHIDAFIPVQGGRGVIRDAVEAIVRAKGIWEQVLEHIEQDEAGGL